MNYQRSVSASTHAGFKKKSYGHYVDAAYSDMQFEKRLAKLAAEKQQQRDYLKSGQRQVNPI